MYDNAFQGIISAGSMPKEIEKAAYTINFNLVQIIKSLNINS